MSEAFPFVMAAAKGSKDLPVFKEFAWDFEKNNFLYDQNGRRLLLEKAEALQVWIYKALATERYRYEAYSWQYGIELRPFIGLVMGVGERISEMKRVITECLMVNPYIVSIDSIEFTQTGAAAHVEIQLSTVYGEVKANV